mmetsp:Transcript_63062/g.150272  ORF Transcript_63062/g.150272 Transcript_63062/m.150272 type:complete len:800 (+) Transcript_63062:119-2518(+)
MNAADLDVVLGLLQSPDNAVRRQAEAQVEAAALNPAFLRAALECTCLASSPQNRQMAATILTWRLPKAWPSLGDSDRSSLQAALLKCFATCSELPVLRVLAEACNALCQAIAVQHNVLWTELLQLVARLLTEESPIHRRGALELLSALVQSMGARLKDHYSELGPALAARIRDPDATVRVAALSAAGVLAESWCRSESDRRLLEVTAEAALEAVASNASDLHVLQAALRALRHIAPTMHSDNLAIACTEVAVRVLCWGPGAAKKEACEVQAAELLCSLARRSPGFWAREARLLSAVVPALCTASKDFAPSVDDIDEVSPVAEAARECLRMLSRANPVQVVPLVYEAARVTSQSRDAMDRAAAVHAVIFALSGAREAPADWAVPLVRALGDSTVWVRQSAYEGAIRLAAELRQSESTTEGLLLLLTAVAERLASEKELELVQKASGSLVAIWQELTTDESAPSLRKVIPVLVASIHRVANEATAASDMPSRDAAAAALASALGAAAASSLDHFEPFVVQSAQVLWPLAQAAATKGHNGTHIVLSSCIEAAGSTISIKWMDPEVKDIRDEFSSMALRILTDEGCPSEVRASAHVFFRQMASAMLEEFSPYTSKVVPPALASLAMSDGGEVVVGRRRRAVRTGGEEERVAAIHALGVYATSVGPTFGMYLPAVIPSVCGQAQHASSAVQAACMCAVARLGKALTSIAIGLTNGHADRLAAQNMVQGMVQALELVARDRDNLGGSALRSAIHAIQDLREHPGFDAFVGPAAIAALMAAVGDKVADDICSTDDEEDANVGDDVA